MNAEENLENISYPHVWTLNSKQKKYLFSFRTNVETSVNKRKEIRFPILNKEGNDDCFEVDWGTWTELKLSSVWLKLITATKSDKTKTVQSIMKIRFLHDREFACVTEIIMKETLTINVSVPFKIFTAINQANS